MTQPDRSLDTDRSRQLLDDSLNDFDAATLSRLNQARQRALSQLDTRRRWAWWQPLTGVALAAALVIALLPRQPQTLPATSVSVGEFDLALLSESEDLELLENLEFYAWLEQEEDWDGSS
ncbi:MAG: hypothetical protein KDI51_10060 [Xanthomonadales bacterium]|nr:hypothetical protein [Xanthomonadales bacterium]